MRTESNTEQSGHDGRADAKVIAAVRDGTLSDLCRTATDELEQAIEVWEGRGQHSHPGCAEAKKLLSQPFALYALNRKLESSPSRGI